MLWIWALLLILILNQSYHQTHIADKPTYTIAKMSLKRYQFSQPILFISVVFTCKINILRQIKKCLELMNWIPSFTTHTIAWYDGLDEFIFFFLVFLLEKTAFDLLAFCSLQRVWLSLDTSGVTTSWITFVCSLVCWDNFFVVVGRSVGT